MVRIVLGAALALILSSCAAPTEELAPSSESLAIQETSVQEQRPEALPASGSAEEGRRLAEINCATCHAIGVAGESRHPMAPPFRTLSQNYPVNSLEEAFAEGILVGHPDMPDFQLEPAQIDHLLAYLNSIQLRQGG
ncbi:MAG: cytochrome c [Hyphomonadaceae bacterium]|nr:cytochrome c [Hyphomonadaceae bacterium]